MKREIQIMFEFLDGKHFVVSDAVASHYWDSNAANFGITGFLCWIQVQVLLLLVGTCEKALGRIVIREFRQQ